MTGGHDDLGIGAAPRRQWERWTNAWLPMLASSNRLYRCGGAGPALGTEERRAAACADTALSPKVAFAISPMPASDPRMLIASIGSMMIFWFGESASCPNALMYLSAMK